MSNVGKNIRTLRASNGMTQEDLAEKLYVSRQTVSNYENGKSCPDLQMLIKIAEVLNTDVNALIYGLPQPPERKKEYLKMAIAFILTLLLGVITFTLKRIIRYELLHFYTSHFFYLRTILAPCFYTALGWTFMQAISLAFKIKPFRYTKASRISLFMTGILASLFILYFPYLIIENPSIPVWSFVAQKILWGLHIWNLNFLFILAGIILWAVPIRQKTKL